MGLLGKVQTDQPWFYAPITYDERPFGIQLERITHFLTVVIEEDWGAFPSVEAEDREYLRRVDELGISKAQIERYSAGRWELRMEGARERIVPHSFDEGWLQWRGPSELLFSA